MTSKRRQFQQRIKQRMAALEMNQAELARHCGVSRGTVTEWLGSKAWLPKGEAMMLLPDALKCDGHWLLTGRRFRR